MKKILIVVLSCLATLSIAETDYRTYDTLMGLMSGDVAFEGVQLAQRKLSVTDGQVIPAKSGVTVLSATAGAVITNALSTPYPAGQIAVFTVVGTGTSVVLDATNTLALGGNATLSATDVLAVWFRNSTNAVKLFSSDN